MKNKKGIALATVLIVFAVISIIGVTVLSVSLGEIRSAEHAEDTTAAYYLARSAVEVVTSDIQSKYADLSAALTNLTDVQNDTDATETDVENAISAYNAILTQFNALGVIPTSSAITCQVNVAIDSQPYTVYINLVNVDGTDVIEASCTATYEGKTSTARAQIGTFIKDTTTLTYYTEDPPAESWLGEHALYSFQDMKLKQLPTVHNGGSLSAQGTILDVHDDQVPDDVGTSGVVHDMPIIVPPTLEDKSSVSLAGTHTLTSADSGYYGALGTPKNKTQVNDIRITWTIDTTNGTADTSDDTDVVLIFTNLYAASTSSINVVGGGKLYIYIQEPYTYGDVITKRILINLAGQSTITSNGTLADPQVYFIVYNDTLQWYRQTYSSTNIPASDAMALPEEDYDIVFIENLSNISAFFYLPGCTADMTNNYDLYGSVYASYINVANLTNIYYYPFDYEDLFAHSSTPPGDPVLVPHNSDPITTYTPNYSRVWVR
jgi:type II secretory pathway pseudopilin PulG